jgi:hypothetical protein
VRVVHSIGKVFYIGFTSAAQVDEEGWRCADGELTLGDASEGFQSDLHTWSMAEYEAQWRTAVARLLAGQSVSALLTSYRGPEGTYHSMWPMWREGTTVYVQERLLFTEALAAPFNPRQAWAVVGERTIVSEEGRPMSEWVVPLGQFATYMLDT